MKRRRYFLLIVMLALFASASGMQDTAQYKVLFEKARFTMETKGDLDGAIQLFNEIINTYPDERVYAARSQLYIGLCYERQGLEEARKAYRKVMENYPEQTKEVAQARENLNRLLASLEPPDKAIFRKINIPTELAWTVKLSPDGEKLLMGSDKKLWALPLEGNLGPGYSGTPVQIDTEGTEVEWSGLCWSYDGKWIAFNEFPETIDSLVNQWICIVPSEGGDPKKLFKPYRDVRIVNYQLSMTPDGKNLAFSSVKEDKQYIYSIPVEGGNPKELADMEAREPVYSPDGKMIAFAADRGIGRGEGDLGLWIIPSGEGGPHQVSEAVKATSPVWSPDGSMIAYIDEGQPRMYIIRINDDGQPIGNPVSIEAPEGTAFIKILAGWTPQNKIGCLLVTEQESAIYTLPVQGGQAAMIQRSPGVFISQPRWSPDGKQVYYSAPPGEENSNSGVSDWMILASVPSSGGQGGPVPGDLNEKEIRLGHYGTGNRVSPDGKSMIAGAWTPEDLSVDYFYPMFRIWKIALDGSGSKQITRAKGPFLDAQPCWSPDGTRIAFVRHGLIKGKTNDSLGDEEVYLVDSSGGEPELLYSIPSGNSIFSLVWAPDGKKLACFIRKKEPPWSTNIYVLNAEDGTATTVGDIQEAVYSGHSELAWSPDGKRIAFNYNDDVDRGIKVMTLSDGSIEEIETGLPDLDRIIHFDWSPDGERFVFVGWKNGKKEFWLMEDFLPL